MENFKISFLPCCLFCSFVYFWVPNVLFNALSYYNWISWAAPENFNVATTGWITEVGLNPVTTFDLNIIGTDGPVIPFFVKLNNYLVVFLALFVILALWWTN